MLGLTRLRDAAASRDRGFTLIELLVVVAMISIMLTIAVPSFRSFIANYRVTSASNEFLQGVTQTRTEAIKRGRRVMMMPNDATSGLPSSTGSWKNGWSIFVDSNNNLALDTSEELIAKHGPMSGSITPTDAATGSSNVFVDAGKTEISFDGTGFPRYVGGGLIIGGMVLTDTSAGSTNNRRTFCIASMGAARIVQGSTTCS